MKKAIIKILDFSSSWTGTIIIVLFFVFFIAQTFVIPSGSMKRTLLIGDFLIAKKFVYGTPTPELPVVGIKVLPDFNNNGHLITADGPKRGDIVIFYVPTNKKDHYVKRAVAVGGDEILYYDKHLLLHPHEGDEYIKKNYNKSKIIKANGKLWVDNPYKDKFPGIQYAPEYNGNSFNLMLMQADSIDMKPVYAEDLNAPVTGYSRVPINAFYKKVEENHYYMIGDNRDNSSDSRFWGSVPYSLIIGAPWMTVISMEFREYKTVSQGDKHGIGKDHMLLNKMCKDEGIESKACEDKWKKYRFTIRWDRMFKNINNFQYEKPVR